MNLIYLWAAIGFYLALYFLVALHELGHYFFAKICGFQILNVRIGIGKIFSTGLFTFGILPISGDTTIDMTEELFEDKNQALKFALRKSGGVIFQLILLIPCLIVEANTDWFVLQLFNTLNIILITVNMLPLQFKDGSITDGRSILVCLSSYFRHKPIFTRESYSQLLDEIEAEDLGITMEELKQLREEASVSEPHTPTQEELEDLFAEN